MATYHIVNFQNQYVELLKNAQPNNFYFSSPTLKFYSGSAPANVETAVTGTLLSTATPASGWWSAPSNGIAPWVGNQASGLAAASGTIGYARLATGSGDLMDLSVGTSGSGADVILDSLATTSGVTTPTITAFAVKIPMSNGTVLFNIAAANLIAATYTSASGGTLAFGNNQGLLKIYSGTPPAAADDTATGTLLWSSAISSTSTMGWNAASGGAATLGTPIVANASATGTAGYARITNSSDAYRMQCSVGVAGSGADVILASLSLTSGVSMSVTEATLAF